MAEAHDLVRDALVHLLRDQPRPVALDPPDLLARLQAHVGSELTAEHPLLRATALATRTGALRGLTSAPPTASAADVAGALRTLGVPDEAAADAARLWAEALEQAGPGAATSAAAAAVTIVDQPLAPPAAPPAPAVLPATTSTMPTTPTVAGRPDTGKRSVGVPALVLAVVALAAIVAAVLGWSRDPSKERAADAENRASELTATLDRTRTSLTTAEASLAQRTAELATAKEQATQMGTLTRAQFAGAPLPQRFALTGRVTPGSCTLTGEACNVSTTVRNIALSCTGATCDCTNGSCTITSDLWKTAVPVAYDAATGLYTSKGNLDADLFRCGGVPQPTSFEFRFRVTRLAWNGSAWLASGIEAELAQASSATDCLAGNRTYALSGPAA